MARCPSPDPRAGTCRSPATSWLWIGDRFIVNFPESQRFYGPVISDPLFTKTIFVGAQRVWRTTTAGGDRTFLENHCNTAVGEFPSDLLYTGACGNAAEWPPLGASTLTGSAFGTTKSGGTLSSIARGNDTGTLWAASGAGRSEEHTSELQSPYVSSYARFCL